MKIFKRIWVFLIFAYATNVFSEKVSVESKEVKEGLKKIQTKFDTKIIECPKYDYTPESSQKSSDPCADLFEAACYDDKDDNKYAKTHGDMNGELNKNLEMAFDLAIKEHGHESASSFFIKEFADDGIILDRQETSGQIDLFGKITFSPSGFDVLDNCLKAQKEFEDKKKEIEEDKSIKIGARLSAVYKLEKKEAEDAKGFVEGIKKIYHTDLKIFLSEGIDKQCDQLTEKSLDYPEEQNKDAAKICQQRKKIRYEALDIIRDDKKDPEKVSKFVAKYFIPPLTPKLKTESSIKMACDALKSNFRPYADEKTKKIRKKLLSTKSSIEYLNKTYFQGEKFENIKRNLTETIEDVKKILPKFVKDPKTREKIIKEYDQISLFKINNPPDAYYTKAASGALILDESKIPSQEDSYSYFFDEKMSFFKDFNASYSPTSSTGVFSKSQTVVINPALVLQGFKYPLAASNIIGHEVGHKLGPEISHVSGHPLKEDLSAAFQCLKSPKSIALKPFQEDEATGDLIAAEILAEKLEKIPMKERKQALFTSISSYCFFSIDKTSTVDFSDSHPDPLLRVSGIFGANPNIRKALGCKGDSKKFKSCGVQGGKK